jgi:ERCC4-type nuclease
VLGGLVGKIKGENKMPKVGSKKAKRIYNFLKDNYDTNNNCWR